MSDFVAQGLFSAVVVFIGAAYVFVTSNRVWDWWWSESLKTTPIRRMRFRLRPETNDRAKAGQRAMLRILGVLIMGLGLWMLIAVGAAWLAHTDA